MFQFLGSSCTPPHGHALRRHRGAILSGLFAVSLGCSAEPGTFIDQDASLRATPLAERAPLSQPESELGLGGSVGGLDLDCELAATPSGGSCEPTDDQSACQACVAARCCEEQAACNSLEPMNACAFGSTLLEGRAIEGGEVACMMECFADLASTGNLDGDESDIDACAASCGASECGTQPANLVSRELASCILGDTRGDQGCRLECGLSP